MKKDKIYITARAQYVVNGYINAGYQVFRPYKDQTIIGRLLRELWFMMRLPEEAWYSRKCLKAKTEQLLYVIIQDPLITPRYLSWIKTQFANVEIIYQYANLVGKARHTLPCDVPEKITMISYDKGDCEKYGMIYRNEKNFFKCYIGKKKIIKYDVFFVGMDKGRGKYLCELKKQFEDMGLKTKFIITSDGRFAIRKKYYSRHISYEKVINFDNESRAIINIVMPGQTGLTLRDFESVFNEVKLITNNVHIRDYDIYNKNNIFILNERNLNEIPDFLRTPFEKIDEKILEKYLFI